MKQKILHSIQLLQKAEKIALSYDPDHGYYLAFSGGKDSQCLYHIAQLAGVRFQAHMNLTSVDPPEVIRFVKKNYPEVELIKPGKSIFQHAIEKQILPTMRVRWCCAEYKEMAGAGKVTLIGIRHQESSRRAQRNEVEISNRKFSGTLQQLDQYRNKRKASNSQLSIVNAHGERTLGCISGKETLLISPIIHWTERDVWDFLNALHIPHCILYDQGCTRIGCILCPMSSPRQKQKDIQRWPHVKRNWIKAIKAIRIGGYSEENISCETSAMAGSSQKRQRIAQDAGGYINHPDPGHWMGGGEIRGAAMPTFRICKQWVRTNDNWKTKQRRMESRSTGFSSSSSSDRLTEEQENQIAENIFDWWISGKSYKRWYADKFLQLKIKFDDK